MHAPATLTNAEAVSVSAVPEGLKGAGGDPSADVGQEGLQL